MSATATVTIRTQIAGQTISQSISRTEEHESRVSIAVPAGKAGTLTTRTDDNTGVATVASGHGVTTSDVVSVFWSGGSRYGMTVSATTSTTISVDGGSGDNLPTATTAIIVSKQVAHALELVGDKLELMTIRSTQRGSVEFFSSAPASLLRYDIAAGEGRFWIDGIGYTNPLAGDTVATIQVANGSATADTLEIGLLRSTD
jgi:hypothetical protein